MAKKVQKKDEVKFSSGGCLKVLFVIVVCTILATVCSVWLLKTYVFPSEFKPVTLNTKESVRLEAKLAKMYLASQLSQHESERGNRSSVDKAVTLKPEPYSEKDANRHIAFTERELNALLAKNTDLAKQLVFDLSPGLVSAKLLLPLDETFPFIGGNTLKLNAGVDVRYYEGKPVVILRGVSAWGVPLPNAWLGNLKNVDIIQEFSGRGGFWQSVAAGVADVEVEEGRMRVWLKE